MNFAALAGRRQWLADRVAQHPETFQPPVAQAASNPFVINTGHGLAAGPSVP